MLPGYLEAVGVRPLAGRLFEEADRAAGEAAVINTAASEQYFDGNALGHTLRLGRTVQRHLRVGVKSIPWVE